MIKNIVINGTSYKITIFDDTTEPSSNLFGDCNFIKRLIRIRDTEHNEMYKTLLHEILHVIMFDLGKSENDEEIVSQLSSILFDTLNRNKLLNINEKK